MSDSTKLELVVVRNTEYDFTSVLNVDELEFNHNIVQITEPYTVHFRNLDQSVVQEAMIQDVIAKMAEDERKYEEKVRKYDEKLSELRALAAPKNDFDDDRPF
jgi:phage regulator Rha-like protein